MNKIIIIFSVLSVIILHTNVQSQPNNPVLKNDVYFENIPGELGPGKNYSATYAMGPPPPPNVPIDSNIVILMVLGIGTGVFSLIHKQRKLKKFANEKYVNYYLL